MRILTDIQQGSDEWREVRKGVLTASLADKILTPSGRPSSQAKALRARLLAEKMGWQEPAPDVQTDWMGRGIALEDEARKWVQFQLGSEIEQVGFIMGNTEWTGCSPDGLINRIIPVEIKCPMPSTHISYLENDELPSDYKAQVHFQLAITGASYGYFISYCPVTEPLIITVPSDEYTLKMGKAMVDHIEKITTLYERLKGE